MYLNYSRTDEGTVLSINGEEQTVRTEMLQLACKTNRKNEPNHRQGSLSFASNSMTFHEFFRDLLTFSITLCLAVTFKNV